jgi:hypothetical protein
MSNGIRTQNLAIARRLEERAHAADNRRDAEFAWNHAARVRRSSGNPPRDAAAPLPPALRFLVAALPDAPKPPQRASSDPYAPLRVSALPATPPVPPRLSPEQEAAALVAQIMAARKALGA